MEAVKAKRGTKPPIEVTAMRCEVMRALLQRVEGASSAELIIATGTSKQNVSLWLKKWGAVRRDGRWYLSQEGV